MKDNDSEFLTQMHKYVAHASVGPSTVRGQHTPGLMARSRDLLEQVPLGELAVCKPEGFPDFLDSQTNRIRKHLPTGAQKWGIARKVLNIFLRDATYNHYLRDHYRLGRFEKLLEVPMDRLTATSLKAHTAPGTLPTWKGVRHLDADDNKDFQQRANTIAAERGIVRVHLDAYFRTTR